MVAVKLQQARYLRKCAKMYGTSYASAAPSLVVYIITNRFKINLTFILKLQPSVCFFAAHFIESARLSMGVSV